MRKTSRIMFAVFAIAACSLVSGCYTFQSMALEARCGIGRDYACISRWFEAGDPDDTNDNELRLVCGCMDKEYLKGN